MRGRAIGDDIGDDALDDASNGRTMYEREHGNFSRARSTLKSSSSLKSSTSFGDAFLDSFDVVVRSVGRSPGASSSSSSSTTNGRTIHERVGRTTAKRGKVGKSSSSSFANSTNEDDRDAMLGRANARGFAFAYEDDERRARFRERFREEIARARERENDAGWEFRREGDDGGQGGGNAREVGETRRGGKIERGNGFFATPRCRHVAALGLGGRDFVSWVELKLALRAQAMKWHPDKHDGEGKAVAEANFKRAYDAYEALTATREDG